MCLLNRSQSVLNVVGAALPMSGGQPTEHYNIELMLVPIYRHHLLARRTVTGRKIAAMRDACRVREKNLAQIIAKFRSAFLN